LPSDIKEKMLADFTITIHEGRKPMAVQVKVHNNVAALRGAAIKTNKKIRRQDDDCSDALGVCHRFHMMRSPLCAIVRLAPPHIGVGIVVHEMGHAAVWMWEIQNKFSTKTRLTCANDEWFCWVLGELTRQTINELYEKGVY
jgi:hypothetical protein